MTKFLDIFFGTPQSKFAAYAIFIAIIAISLSILFSSTDISIGNRFAVVLFVILLSVPSILLTLFELTCIVTGGTKKVNWWCWYFGWLIAAFLSIYSVIIIISILISMFSYNNAMDRIKNTEIVVSKAEANDYAKTVINKEEIIKEKFENIKKENIIKATIQQGGIPTNEGVTIAPPKVVGGMPQQGMQHQEHFTNDEMQPPQVGEIQQHSDEEIPHPNMQYQEHFINDGMLPPPRVGEIPQQSIGGMPPPPRVGEMPQQSNGGMPPPPRVGGIPSQLIGGMHPNDGMLSNQVMQQFTNGSLNKENFNVNGTKSIPAPIDKYNYSSF